MKRPLKIGITGGIGSGKSTVCNIFAQFGVPTYNADDMAKWLMQYLPELQVAIKKIFGTKAYEKNGTINRLHIAKLAFANPHMLQQLNAVVHPAVLNHFNLWSTQQPNTYVIKEAALMFESNSFLDVDAIVTIASPEALRIKRTMARDQIDKQSVMMRIKYQMPEAQKIKLADFVITNNETELLLPQIMQLHGLWS